MSVCAVKGHRHASGIVPGGMAHGRPAQRGRINPGEASGDPILQEADFLAVGGSDERVGPDVLAEDPPL